MIERILTAEGRTVLADERDWLGRLQRTLAALDATDGDQVALARSIRQLDQFFLLVVIGEFNAGKSTFINALVGAPILEEGVTPTTTRIQVLTYGDMPSRTTAEAVVDIVTAPVEFLREIHIVDTPGTNAIEREHERITGEFVPRADLVLFVTSVDRPFTESERAFLETIRDWGKKIVVVLNKVDILEGQEEVTRILHYVADSARAALGLSPDIFAVASRRALRAKQGQEAPAPPGDQFGALEQYIHSTLDQGERLKLKLLNPLGVGLRLADAYRSTLDERLSLLEEDERAIEDIEASLRAYREDLAREFGFRLSQIDNELHQFENRGMAFFDETVRVGRVFDLLNKSRVKAEFERAVVADLPQAVEREVSDIIDWMVGAELRQWQAVTQHVNRRQSVHADRIVGEPTGFHYDRARLLETVGRAAHRAVDGYDKEKEASAMAESARMAVAGTALAQAGAISLGALVTMLATTTAADVTGILAAGAVAALGLFVIPSRRHRAKRELRQKVSDLRNQLMGSLRSHFDREVERSALRIANTVAPYTGFVRAERARLAAFRQELQSIGDTLERLKAAVDRME